MQVRPHTSLETCNGSLYSESTPDGPAPVELTKAVVVTSSGGCDATRPNHGRGDCFTCFDLSFILHLGHLPGWADLTSLCIGQTYIAAPAPTVPAADGRVAALDAPPPPPRCAPCRFFAPRAPGSALLTWGRATRRRAFFASDPRPRGRKVHPLLDFLPLLTFLKEVPPSELTATS